MLDLSDELKQFLFSHVDSVELLEILLLMRSKPEKSWTAEALSQELRGSALSAENRLGALEKLGLAQPAEPGEFVYRPASPKLAELMEELAEKYKTQRHRILSLIFSPMKKALDFAHAFKIRKNEEET